jgi:DNA-binding XRE family transcriptional regulator
MKDEMRLHEYRKHLGMTQAELAQRIEMGHSTYVRFENLHKKGGTVPALLTLAVAQLADNYVPNKPAVAVPGTAVPQAPDPLVVAANRAKYAAFLAEQKE